MDSDLLTLQAFLLTLPQLDTDLSDDLQRAVHKVGHDLANHHPAAVDEIRELVEQNDCLKTVYQETYDRLESQAQPNERVKIASLTTLALRSDTTWETFAVSILTAHNPIAAARSMVRKTVHHWRQSATDKTVRRAVDTLGAPLAFLSKVAQKVESQDIAILRALKYGPRTVEDLSYTLGMPLEQVRAIVASLWEAGEIDRLNGSLWHRLLPILKPDTHVSQPIDPHDYFTVTLKGHFRLRPLFKVRQQEGIVG